MEDIKEQPDNDLLEDGLLEQEDAPAVDQVAAVDALLLRQILEGAILAAAQPLTVARMIELFDEAVAPDKEDVQEALRAIQADCEGRGFELKEVASGWRFQVRDTLAGWVNRLWEEKPQKYSRALLETLALIAYRQPITRGDIEEIRGVAVSSHIMKTLMERDWVKVVGHRDVPGRPSLYATTRQFLDYFNLKNLEELPSLSEIRDLDEINASLELTLAGKDKNASLPAAETVEEGEPSGGEADQDVIPEQFSQDIAETLAQEEFVDGEEAFEIVDNAASFQNSTLSDPEGEAATDSTAEDIDRNA